MPLFFFSVSRQDGSSHLSFFLLSSQISSHQPTLSRSKRQVPWLRYRPSLPSPGRHPLAIKISTFSAGAATVPPRSFAMGHIPGRRLMAASVAPLHPFKILAPRRLCKIPVRRRSTSRRSVPHHMSLDLPHAAALVRTLPSVPHRTTRRFGRPTSPLLEAAAIQGRRLMGICKVRGLLRTATSARRVPTSTIPTTAMLGPRLICRASVRLRSVCRRKFRRSTMSNRVEKRNRSCRSQGRRHMHRFLSVPMPWL